MKLIHYHSSIFKILTICILILFSSMASAVCFRITGYNSDPNNNVYTEPGKGTAKNWNGSVDNSGSLGSTPRVINVNNDDFQPRGTLIATGFLTIFEAGDQGFDPEQILFRCTADEQGKLKEFYATNGDYVFGGYQLVDPSLNLEETYLSLAYQVGIRITNATTGQYFSRYWKSRPLTDLERDSKGWILVKAKNFSNMQIELFKIGPTQYIPPTTQGLITKNQPSGYIAFQSSNMSTKLADGLDSQSVYDGFHAYWPGAANMYNHLTVRNTATCIVRNVTPYVNFPPITVSMLSNNQSIKAPVNIDFSCQTSAPATNNTMNPMVSGTNSNQTAMGFLPQPTNISKAMELGLTVPGGSAITHLVSDNYGTDDTMAKGVGVKLYTPAGTALNLLSTVLDNGQGTSNGWYPVLNDATASTMSNGLTEYNKTLYASLERLPGQKITAGKFSASMQVIIKVQ